MKIVLDDAVDLSINKRRKIITQLREELHEYKTDLALTIGGKMKSQFLNDSA